MMTLKAVIFPYIKWFNILGQSSYHYSDENGRFRDLYRFLKYVPCVIVLSVTFILTVLKSVIMLEAKSYGSAGTVIVLFTNISYVSSVFISTSRSLLHSSCLTLLFTQVNSFEKLSRKSYTFDSRKFRRNYGRQVSVNIVVHIMPSLAPFFIRSITWRFFSTMAISAVLRVLAFLPTYYVLFYINLFDQMLKSFAQYMNEQVNITIKVLAKEPSASCSTLLASELHHYKLLHFKLWEITQTINTVFGWTLVTIILQYFVMALNNMYYILIVLGKDYSGVDEIIRKYTVHSAPRNDILAIFHCRCVLGSSKVIWAVRKYVLGSRLGNENPFFLQNFSVFNSLLAVLVFFRILGFDT